MTVKLSYEYRDPNYHINADDPSFIFPPNNELLEIKGNLLEIFGQNGTGKSTLLNIIALSMGFVRNVKELRLKPALQEKLQSLEKNTQLQYLLDIETPDPHKFSVNITKQPGRDQIVTINHSQIDSYPLKNFDLIFLTEDDPTKVVTLSIGKLFSHISYSFLVLAYSSLCEFAFVPNSIFFAIISASKEFLVSLKVFNSDINLR